MLTFIIFAILFALMFFGAPVAVCMGLTAVLLLVAKGQGFVLPMVAQRMYASTTGFTLLAIPFFILAGNLMNTGGITRRLFRLASTIVGSVRGGLGHANIIASMIFSGMSGAVVADAAGLGQIEISAMDDAGYDRKFSAAITAASSTIGPIIPPSIPFVIYGSLTGLSVGKLFLAGFTPGVAMGIGMMIAVYFVAKYRNYPKQQMPTFKEVVISVKEAILPMMTPCHYYWRDSLRVLYPDRGLSGRHPVCTGAWVICLSGVCAQRFAQNSLGSLGTYDPDYVYYFRLRFFAGL